MSKKEEKKDHGFDKVENPALLRAMENLKEKEDREALLDFISEAYKAKFISPGIVDKKGGETSVRFVTLKSKDNEILFPAFTSLAEMEKQWDDEDEQPIGCKFEQYIDFITSDTNGPEALVIDPFGTNFVLKRKLLQEIKQSDKTDFGDLKEEPVELEEALKKFFDEEGIIEKAYILATLKKGEVNLLLVIDNRFPEGTSEDEIDSLREDLYHRMAEAVKPEFEEYKQKIAGSRELGFAIADLNTELGRRAVINREPFYKK